VQVASSDATLKFIPQQQTVEIRGIPLRLPVTPFLYYLWYASLQPQGHDDGWFINPPTNRPDYEQGRQLPTDGALNFRNIGGCKTTDDHQVKWGKIYRSSMPAHLTADDYRMLTPLHIGTIADLRSNDERAKDVTHWQAGDIHRITTDYDMDYSQFRSMMKDINADKAKAIFTQMYPGILQQQTDNFRNMFQQLLKDDDALFYHCSAGKDRTGMATMLILTALGVSGETIMRDYLLSNLYYADNIAQFSKAHSESKNDTTAAMMSRLPADVAAVFMEVSPEYLQTTMDSMSKQHGSVMGQ